MLALWAWPVLQSVSRLGPWWSSPGSVWWAFGARMLLAPALAGRPAPPPKPCESEISEEDNQVTESRAQLITEDPMVVIPEPSSGFSLDMCLCARVHVDGCMQVCTWMGACARV